MGRSLLATGVIDGLFNNLDNFLFELLPSETPCEGDLSRSSLSRLRVVIIEIVLRGGASGSLEFF